MNSTSKHGLRLGKACPMCMHKQIAQACSALTHTHSSTVNTHLHSQADAQRARVRYPSHDIHVYVRGPQLVVSGSQHGGKQLASETMWGLRAPWFKQTGWLKSNRSPRSARKGGIITVRKALFGSINLSTLSSYESFLRGQKVTKCLKLPKRPTVVQAESYWVTRGITASHWA